MKCTNSCLDVSNMNVSLTDNKVNECVEGHVLLHWFIKGEVEGEVKVAV